MSTLMNDDMIALGVRGEREEVRRRRSGGYTNISTIASD